MSQCLQVVPVLAAEDCMISQLDLPHLVRRMPRYFYLVRRDMKAGCPRLMHMQPAIAQYCIIAVMIQIIAYSPLCLPVPLIPSIAQLDVCGEERLAPVTPTISQTFEVPR